MSRSRPKLLPGPGGCASLVLAVTGVLASTPGLALDLDEVVRRQKALAPPELAVSPPGLAVTVRQGEAGTAELVVANAGGRTLDWSVASAAKWLSVEPEEGSVGFEGKQRLSVAFDATGLAPGTVRGELSFEAPGAAEGPLAVPVTLTVTPKPEPGPAPPVAARETEPEPEAEPEPDLPATPAPRGDGGRRVGAAVRTGYLSVGSPVRGDSGAAALVGFCLARPLGPRMSWEAGVDVASPGAGDGTFTSKIASGRFDVLFPLAPGNGQEPRSAKPYLLSGAQALVESAEEAGKSYANYAGAVNLGAGARFGGRYDVRATYSVVLGSDNSSGLVLLTAGLSF